MARAKVARKPRAVGPNPPADAHEAADTEVRAVDEVVEEAIDAMVERLIEPPDAVAAIDPIGASKRVRHRFRLSEDESRTLDALKARLLRSSGPVKKGTLLRAGIAVLARMSDDRLATAIDAVPSLGTSRTEARSDRKRDSRHDAADD